VTSPGFLSPADVAELLGCSHDSVLRAIGRGDLRAFRYGRLVRIATADLDAFLTANTTTGRSKRLRSTA
jgi:excisionase family DNA binding protein